jgi:Cd2+/Zn2+-exporting ATPase
MLTGDSQGVAAEIAREAGIADFHAHLLPQEKLSKIKDLRSQGATMMVGDGINDAPALAAADVGVAMGAAGSDTALESADIALMADDLSQLPFLLRLSRRALATIRFNIWFAVAVKLLAVALVFPGWLTLWLAIMADTGAAVLVTLNGMRLLKLK